MVMAERQPMRQAMAKGNWMKGDSPTARKDRSLAMSKATVLETAD